MPKQAPEYLRNNPPASPTTLEAIRDRIAEVRDLENENWELEQRIRLNKERLYTLTRIVLPDMFTEARVPKLTIEASGNLPAVEAERKPYFRANIASDWDEERRKAAFIYLIQNKAGDIIRNEVTAWFGPRTLGDQTKLLKFLRESKMEYEAKRSVPWSTLTAWLKSEIEGGRMPKLDLIGGDVGQVVKLKEISPSNTRAVYAQFQKS